MSHSPVQYLILSQSDRASETVNYEEKKGKSNLRMSLQKTSMCLTSPEI